MQRRSFIQAAGAAAAALGVPSVFAQEWPTGPVRIVVGFPPAGAGSAQHLALEMFKLQAKVDALHVPYKGSGPLLADLMGSQIQYSFETMTAATPHVKSGKVIGVAQTRLKRAKGHPGIPTMQE